MFEEMISVIIPIYNAERYLTKCLNSVVSQTYKNLEIILVDDGSTDQSGKICDDYADKDKRIIVIHKKNGGMAGEARNTGIKASHGKYIGFVDSDDYIAKDEFEMLYSLLQKTDSDIAICNFVRCDDKTDVSFTHIPSGRFGQSVYEGSDKIKALLIMDNANNTGSGTIGNYMWNKLFKRSLFEGVSFPVGRRMFEDYAICHILFERAKRIVYTDTPLYAYVSHSGSIVSTPSPAITQDIYDMSTLRYDYLIKRYPELSKEIGTEYLRWGFGSYPLLDKKRQKEAEKRIKEIRQNGWYDKKQFPSKVGAKLALFSLSKTLYLVMFQIKRSLSQKK